MILALSKAGHYEALFEKLVDTPVNGRLSLDSVHQVETSLSFWSINTKSMVN
jgi:hypothetical protein